MDKIKVLFVNECSYLSTGYARYGYNLLSQLYQDPRFDVAEMGTFFNPFDNKANTLPWKFCPNIPLNLTKEEYIEFAKNPANQMGFSMFNQIALSFQPDVVCFPPGELVMTSEGYKNIEDIQCGELVLTHKNRFKKVIKTYKKSYNGNLKTIRITGDCSSLVCTEEHPILTYKYKWRTKGKKTIAKVYDGLNAQFIKANEVKAEDKVVNPIIETLLGISYIDICDYLKNYATDENGIYPSGFESSSTRIKNNIELNTDFGRLCGYICTDGCIHERSLAIAFHTEEERFCIDACKLFKDIFNIDAYYEKAKEANEFIVIANSVLIAEFFDKFIGSNINKNIPKITFTSNKEFISGIIAGCVRGDGHYGVNEINFTNTNKKLVYNYRKMCETIGLTCTIKKRQEANNAKLVMGKICKTKAVYEASISGENAKIGHELIKKHDIITGLVENAKSRPYRVIKVNEHLISSVTRTRDTKYNGQVYNLEVEEDNSYVVNNVCVHNCNITDFWCQKFINLSPYRKCFKSLWMAPHDSVPQNLEWIEDMTLHDGVLGYTDWALDEIKQASPKVNLLGSAPPSSEQVFSPMNKEDVKKYFGIDPNIKLIGTTMRNQFRKLFPNLFESFREFLDKTKREDVYLYAHTSYPDGSWNIPELIHYYGIAHKVLFTYICHVCNHVFPDFYSDVKTCKNCGHIAAKMTNTHKGVDVPTLAKIYNLFDCYVQYANSEGFGLPMTEATACGIPLFAVDYSAMSDVVRKVGGQPIRVLGLQTEMNTGCKRAFPDNSHLVELLIKFFNKPQSIRNIDSIKTRTMTRKNYSWEATANVWKNAILSVAPKENLWRKPLNNFLPLLYEQRPLQNGQEVGNSEYAKWLLTYVAGRPEKIGSMLESQLIRDLNYGVTTGHHKGNTVNEDSTLFNQGNMNEFTRKNAYDDCYQMGRDIQIAEQVRGEQLGL